MKKSSRKSNADEKYRSDGNDVRNRDNPINEANEEDRSDGEDVRNGDHPFTEANEEDRSDGNDVRNRDNPINAANEEDRSDGDDVRNGDNPINEEDDRSDGNDFRNGDNPISITEANEEYRSDDDHVANGNNRIIDANEEDRTDGDQMTNGDNRITEANEKYRSHGDHVTNGDNRITEANEEDRSDGDDVRNGDKPFTEANEEYRSDGDHVTNGDNRITEANEEDRSDGDDVRNGDKPFTEANEEYRSDGDHVANGDNRINEEDRSSRYVDQTLDEIKTSKTLNDLRPYYSGDLVTERMNLVRDSINYIRENWDKYGEHEEKLKIFLKENNVEFDNPKVQKMLETVLNTNYKWSQPDDKFHAIGLYTAEEGYNKLFSLVNRTFRADESTDLVDKIRNVVFLIELINIDLFNYCYCRPQHDNYQGTVYRGMSLQPQDIQAFTDLLNQSIEKRFISVPLSLWSTTADLDVAKNFIRDTDSQNSQPLLMEIDVIEMKPEYLEYYRDRFPNSVVSTICAVTIKDLSMFPREYEVLLRGAFFQVLDLYEGPLISGKPCKVLHMVTVNSNRDHISSVQLGDDTNIARQLFGTMVNITRSEYAVKYFSEKNNTDEVTKYETILNQKKEALSKLID